ncbi:MAG: DUF6285 domain-containing protein [Anaerolineae bacterium]|jgi:hypothetical protein|nr:DUF6285 domain-containing protein [Anaerolineae bacterium]
MYDRPSALELIAAARLHLAQQALPALTAAGTPPDLIAALEEVSAGLSRLTQDDPAAAPALTAARVFVQETLVPVTKALHHKLYFQTLVAVSVLKIVEREWQQREAHYRAEWARLDALTGAQPAPAAADALTAALAGRNVALCAAIRAGQHDHRRALFDHLKATTVEQLAVANPGYLSALLAEDAAR